jgi:formate dehydrogenase subunit delta
MSLPKLVYMANQISRFFASEDKGTAVAATADHLRKYWDPRMRAGVIAHVEAGGEGLTDVAREAIATLPASTPAKR